MNLKAWLINFKKLSAYQKFLIGLIIICFIAIVFFSWLHSDLTTQKKLAEGVLDAELMKSVDVSQRQEALENELLEKTKEVNLKRELLESKKSNERGAISKAFEDYVQTKESSKKP